MKSIAARYDGHPLSASYSRAADADCSSSSVNSLTASVSLRTSRSRSWSIGPSLIEIGGSAHASHTSPDSWSVFSGRSDKPIDVDGESVLKDHSVGVDGNEPRCAAGAIVFHRRGIDTERRAALVAEGNPEALTPRGRQNNHGRTSSRPPRVLLGKSSQRPPGSAPGALSHSDNGRLSTPWREVIFLSTVMDSLFDPSSPAFVYGPKSAHR